MQRRYDLDWLRVIAFGLLMLFHTGMMFSTWDWHVKNIETSESFDYLMRWLHQWRMPLLFFISGSAVWFAMERYSARQFFVERQKRLLLPLVFGMLVVIPPQVYCERLYHHEQYDSFWDFYRTVFTSGAYPQGNLSWHHLWYVPYIWAFSMLMFPAFLAVRSDSGREVLSQVSGWMRSPWALLLLFVPGAVAEIVLRPFWPGDANNLFADWANFAHKLTFFVAGFVLASDLRVYDTIAAHRRKFLLMGIGATVVLNFVWVSDSPFSAAWLPAYRALSNFHIWMWLLAVLGYGRRYLNFNHPVLRYANEAVYPFYILHQTVIIILAYQLAYMNWGIGTKFLIVAAATFLISWVLYAYVIKPWNFLRVPFGMKWLKPREDCQGRPAGSPIAPSGSAVAVVFGLSLWLFTSCSRPHSQLVCQTIDAPSLSHNLLGISDRQEVVVYLPPSYWGTNRRFPVVYFLPNFKTELWRYTGGTYQGFRLRDAIDRGIHLGRSEEMIVVVPNAAHFLGGSWYLNSPLTGNWEDFVVRDLVAFADSHFRTVPAPEGRGLAGHGMGGIGALDLALKHPDVFSAVYAMSPVAFDQNGLDDMGVLGERSTRKWRENLAKWDHLDEMRRRKSFRDYIQSSLNSPSRTTFMDGLFASYAAAVSPDLSLPYPHIAYLEGSEPGESADRLRNRFESASGRWEERLRAYLAKGRSLRSITIECGGDGEYDWIRRGAEHVSRVMHSMGIPNTLAMHAGGHDSRLGMRLEAHMLPEISKSLGHRNE